MTAPPTGRARTGPEAGVQVTAVSQPVVLLVAYDNQQRDEVATWLEQAGLAVLPCPGPCPPDYVCVGGRRRSCPLPRAADLVVLDLQLASDEVHEGTPARQLLELYTSAGLPVVALAGPGEAPLLADARHVRVLPRPPARELLLAAVSGFL